MTIHSSVFTALILAAGLLGSAPVLSAAARADLYQTTSPMSDRSEISHTAAFQAAMRTVLIRVTGRRSAEQDPALAPLIAEARRFVQQYRTATDGQLWVSFDGAAIERWLAQNGQQIWGRERPATFVWLAVPTGPQSGSVVTRDDTSELKASIDAEAAARGISLIWPSAAELQTFRMDYSAVTNLPAMPLADLGRRLGGEGVLIGRMMPASAGPTLHWVHVFQDRNGEFSGPVEGVDGAADAYAALFATSGGPTPVVIEVSGVGDVRAYAKVQSYLESLTFVSHVSVQAMSADRVTFWLSVRGGAGSLQRAFALNSPLESIGAGADGVQRFRLRP